MLQSETVLFGLGFVAFAVVITLVSYAYYWSRAMFNALVKVLEEVQTIKHELQEAARKSR